MRAGKRIGQDKLRKEKEGGDERPRGPRHAGTKSKKSGASELFQNHIDAKLLKGERI